MAKGRLERLASKTAWESLHYVPLQLTGASPGALRGQASWKAIQDAVKLLDSLIPPAFDGYHLDSSTGDLHFMGTCGLETGTSCIILNSPVLDDTPKNAARDALGVLFLEFLDRIVVMPTFERRLRC